MSLGCSTPVVGRAVGVVPAGGVVGVAVGPEGPLGVDVVGGGAAEGAGGGVAVATDGAGLDGAAADGEDGDDGEDGEAAEGVEGNGTGAASEGPPVRTCRLSASTREFSSSTRALRSVIEVDRLSRRLVRAAVC